jgi:hypothetical protein
MMFRRQETLITLESRGTDAREVFVELFAQAKVDFVLQVDIARPVYLTLRETPFLRALQLLCEATNTRYSVRDGVYYIAPLAAAPPPAPPVQATERPRTVRLVGSGLTLRGVAAEIGKQAGVKVSIAPDAPDLRFNLNLPSVSVEAALDALCEGTGLRWQKQGDGYVIAPVSPPQARPAPRRPSRRPLRVLRPPTRAPRPAAPSRPTSPCAAPSAATPCNSTGATARSAARM